MVSGQWFVGVSVVGDCGGTGVAVVGEWGYESAGSEASGSAVSGRVVGCSWSAAGPAARPVLCS